MYRDGDFTNVQWRDIDTSRYRDAINYVTRTCYFHGFADSPIEFNPSGNIDLVSYMKIVARVSQLLPSSFNHYEWETNGYENWYDPYVEVFPEEWLDGTTLTMDDQFVLVSKYDALVIAVRILQLKGLLSDDIDVVGRLPERLKTQMVSRGEIANLMAVFDKKFREIGAIRPNQ